MIVKDRERVRDALNVLGLALTDHDHVWTDEQKQAYNRAMVAIERDNKPGEPFIERLPPAEFATPLNVDPYEFHESDV
jgi:hypothetical protein